ncbi:hypothetical protein T310_0951 [Rasamsonia emersonii CBS 393.64]|uniref:Calpain catalytic domain-containing protein n=1 Tax=Rasamsonia emersonii (strain ATCC 16479 / CBS 393.64 / IMI 116815) TaxID=1408163 RepID=A0A0F4Z4R6_RASE3|nr:hypothetical protein T310_0951 [Rasamsonia emersonii CBS 393.64]KKA25086.1 hypothetical protein T310_0951 [Rasamsonia emersonii CBS 393.64]
MPQSTASSTPNAFVTQALKYERKISTATSQSQALEAAIDAAENYMKALKLASSPKEKQALDAKCKELLTKAEQIKDAKVWKPTRLDSKNVMPPLKEPKSTRKLTTREEIILLEGAKLNGFLFPPWTAAPNPKEFELGHGETKFVDKPDLALSSSQQNIFAGWKRPDELLASISPNNESSTATPTMVGSGVVDLVQDITTDCSVVASLCAAASRMERGHHQSTIYPYDDDNNVPKLSATGKYIFRFHFNGCYRKVVIDDRLPASKTSRSIHVVDRNNPNLLWPALVEKAYLKVRGGYDFPGSNSGTDLWVLSGWIPEQVFLHHEDVTSDELWKRLFKAFQYGDVLLTVGTGKLTEREERLLGLIGQHDYAVLDMTESNGRRRMLIKNPWAETNIHAQESAGMITDLQHETSSPRNQLTTGSFWMDCDKVFQNFENLYLNWNPGLFRFREDIHFSWDLSKPRGNPGCFAGNPQFAVSSEAGGPVWLLLSKHFRTLGESKSQDPMNNEPGFISIYVYKKDGQRVYLSDGALHRGPFVDSPNTLAKLEMPPRTTYTVVIAEQSVPSLNQNFTLSAFSRDPVTLSRAHDKFAHVAQIHGGWTPATAGGNVESPRYPSNPQFSLQLSEAADVSILLETSEPDLAVHIKLFWSDGKRISTVRKRDLIACSGDYRRGCAVAEANNLGKGSYTIVCSTFAPDQVGKFTLLVSSTSPCNVKALASEAAGRHTVISGIGVFAPGTDRILAPLRVPRLTRVKLIARCRDSRIGNRSVAASPMLMTVELGQGPYKKVLASSEGGDYSDAVSGIRVDDFDIRPEDEQRGGIWIVIERIGGPGGQVEEHVEVEALGEERVEIGEWTT